MAISKRSYEIISHALWQMKFPPGVDTDGFLIELQKARNEVSEAQSAPPAVSPADAGVAITVSQEKLDAAILFAHQLLAVEENGGTLMYCDQHTLTLWAEYKALDAARASLSAGQGVAWQPIDDAAKSVQTGIWLKFPDGHVEWGKWGWSANAETEAFGTYPMDENGNRYPCFLPFKTAPLEYFIERRKSPSAAPQSKPSEGE